MCAWFGGVRAGLSVALCCALRAHGCLLALGAVLALCSVQFLPLQSFLHLCVVVQSLPHWVNDVLLQNE